MDISNRERLSLSTVVIIRVCRISKDPQGSDKNGVGSSRNSSAVIENTIESSAPSVSSRLVDRRRTRNSTKSFYAEDSSGVGVSAICGV